MSVRIPLVYKTVYGGQVCTLCQSFIFCIFIFFILLSLKCLMWTACSLSLSHVQNYLFWLTRICHWILTMLVTQASLIEHFTGLIQAEGLAASHKHTSSFRLAPQYSWSHPSANHSIVLCSATIGSAVCMALHDTYKGSPYFTGLAECWVYFTVLDWSQYAKDFVTGPK